VVRPDLGYVELHCHSAYSFLDGASLPAELAERAAELGYGALALTDHNSLAGSMELAQAARGLGLRALHGAEVDLEDGRHVTLLVRNARGWANLCALLTRAHAHTREVSPGAPPLAPAVALETLLEHAQGLVCLTGCARRGVHDEDTAGLLCQAFGREGMRVELQRPYERGDGARNRALERLARRLGVPTVASGDIHAHTPMRALLSDALIAVRHGLMLDSSESLRPANHTRVLAPARAMAARFHEHRGAVAETARLAEELEFELTTDLGYRYPGSEDPDALRKLAGICHTVFARRYPPSSDHHGLALGRLEEELRVIEALGLSGFFLLHHDLLVLAREVAREVRGELQGRGSPRSLLAPGRGRGSSVSSIVCYLTGLSHIDPIANELLLSRFLHEDLESLPDIDIDFPRDIRERLIPRVHERYGRDRVALVAAFSSYRTRGAIRDLGKALGLPAGEVERLTRVVDGGMGGEIEEDIRRLLGRPPGPRWQWLGRLVREAYGLPRHLSQHPGGMVIATRPLNECCPIVPSAMTGRQIVQWDKDSCADAGFLKIDLLGLGMLSAVERCVELIAETRNERIDLSRISFSDEATFEAIQRAETTGAFQIESRAQMSSLRRTRPRTLEDLTIQVAIVRPGPIVGGAVNPYLRRLQRLRADPAYEVPCEHPSLEEPLRFTLGTIIFQDQVIEVARAFAGFSAGEAEGLRRAMSRKRSAEALERHRRRFVEGAMSTHGDVDEALAERVFSMIRGFSGFGFPKAHAAAFGLLAYQSTWLRVHHGPEFLCALLNEQPMGFYSSDALIQEAKRSAGNGLSVLRPDVNASELDCTVDARGAVRVGLRYVKGLDREELIELLRTRHAAGPFTTLQDLASRSGMTGSSLARLAFAGAIPDTLAGSRREALWRLGVAQSARPASSRSTPHRQLALPLSLPAAPVLPALGSWEATVADYAATGVSVERHPLELLREELAAQGAVSVADVERAGHGARLKVGGLVIARQRPQTAGGIMFLLLEDEHGTLNVIVSRELYERHRPTLRAEPLLVVAGRLERHPEGGGGINLIARHVEPLGVPGRRPAEVAALARRRATGGPGEAGAEEAAAGDAPGGELADLRPHAPPAIHFAQGRRR